jgi:lipopolysaccharide biosynthesis glycosyltransferase
MTASPTPNKAVVLLADSGYAPAAYVIARQAMRALQGRAHVIIATTDTASAALIAGCDPRLKVVSFQSSVLDEKLPVNSATNRIIYAKLFLSSLIGKAYDRILYLDSDVWICSESFARLFDLDMQGNAIAAARDVLDLTHDKEFADYKVRLGLSPQTPYFNSGLMLVDVAKYEADEIGQRALEYILKGNFRGQWHDQSGLNHVLKGRYLEISSLWNWHACNRSPTVAARFAPIVRHFTGRSKPWNDFLGRLDPTYSTLMKQELANTPWPKFVLSADEVGHWTYRLPRYVKHRIVLGHSAARTRRRRIEAVGRHLRDGQFADFEQGIVSRA